MGAECCNDYCTKTDFEFKKASHEAKAFAVTCMDFRLLNDAARHLNRKGYDLNYDQFVLAGVSIGILKNSDWYDVLKEHIEISQKLHHTKELILIDHLDCGAYKTYCPNLKKEKERDEHIKNLKIVKDKIKKDFPSLIITKWLLHLEGDLEILE